MTSGVRIGLALGGGGARGLAHLHALAAFDELGVKPAAIAGSSIGAIIGASYAAGFSSDELRLHTALMLRTRASVARKLMRSRVGRITDVFRPSSRNPMQLDAEKLLAQVLPAGVPETFEELKIPFCACVTDFFARDGLRVRSGPLRPSIAASAAIPGVFRPVMMDGRLMIDGAMTDPLPFEALDGEADAVIAVDVTGGPVVTGRGSPNAFMTMMGATQILQSSIVASKVARRAPAALIRPTVDGVTLLDFFRSGKALRMSEAAKDETKRAIERLIETGGERAGP